jgi:hypothetical protein
VIISVVFTSNEKLLKFLSKTDTRGYSLHKFTPSTIYETCFISVFLCRRAAARYGALALIIPGLRLINKNLPSSGLTKVENHCFISDGEGGVHEKYL